MFFVNPVSAYAMINSILDVRPGRWLLQSGGSGALASLANTLCHERGVRTLAIVRSEASIAAARAAGADEVVILSEGGIVEQVAQLTQGKGVHYALDCIGGEVLSEITQCLTLEGHLVVYGTLAADSARIASRDLMMPGARISGLFIPNWLAERSIPEMLRMVRVVKKLLSTHSAVEIAQTYPLEQVHQALEASVAPARGGKILLDLRE